MKTDGHVTGLTLMAYLDGELSGAEAASVRDHCASCAECSSELDMLQSLYGALGEDRDLDLTGDPVWPSVRAGIAAEKTTPMFAVGTVAACFLGIVIGVWAEQGETPSTDSGGPMLASQVAWQSMDYLWSVDDSDSFLENVTEAIQNEGGR